MVNVYIPNLHHNRRTASIRLATPSIDSHPHIDQIGGKAGFFISPDRGVVGGIDVEAELGEAAVVRPGF